MTGVQSAEAVSIGSDAPQRVGRRALVAIVAMFAVSRLLTVLTAVFVELMLPAADRPPAWDPRPILASLTGFDAIYYLGIAADGYHLEPVRVGLRDWVFFPGFPVVTRVASVLTGGDIAIAAVLVSNAALLGALLVLYALSRRYLDEQVSTRSIAYLAIAPGAVAFGMAYSDSLFLLVAAGAFLAAERGRFGLMALLLAAATLTRLPGVLLIIPLGVLLWRRPGTTRTALAWLVAGPLALLAFMAYQGAVLGDPLAFLTAQVGWNFPSRPGEPGSVVAQIDPVAPLLTGVLLVSIFLLVYVRTDRLPLPYVVLAVVTMVTALSSLRLLSIARYLVVAWPFSWLLASRPAAWVHLAWPSLSAGLFVLFAVLHFTESMAP
jgi:hypothetical protein